MPEYPGDIFTTGYAYDTALRLVDCADSGLLNGANHPPLAGTSPCGLAWQDPLAGEDNAANGLPEPGLRSAGGIDVLETTCTYDVFNRPAEALDDSFAASYTYNAGGLRLR